MPSIVDSTRNERQARLRSARKKWLAEHGFNSAEGLVGALMRGDVVLTYKVKSIPWIAKEKFNEKQK